MEARNVEFRKVVIHKNLSESVNEYKSAMIQNSLDIKKSHLIGKGH